VEIPTATGIFVLLGISESSVVPGSGPSGAQPILQQVTPEVAFDTTKHVFLESVRPLRTGEGKGPPARRSWAGRLIRGCIGRTAEALVRGYGKKVVLVGWGRGFISCPGYA
jgi:hypothetical protein